jgi:hypothetical protein
MAILHLSARLSRKHGASDTGIQQPRQAEFKWRMTMTTTKAAMLAALAALTVGVVAATAGGPDGLMPDHQSPRVSATAMNGSKNIHRGGGQLESSSPEVNSKQLGIFAQ